MREYGFYVQDEPLFTVPIIMKGSNSKKELMVFQRKDPQIQPLIHSDDEKISNTPEDDLFLGAVAALENRTHVERNRKGLESVLTNTYGLRSNRIKDKKHAASHSAEERQVIDDFDRKKADAIFSVLPQLLSNDNPNGLGSLSATVDAEGLKRKCTDMFGPGEVCISNVANNLLMAKAVSQKDASTTLNAYQTLLCKAFGLEDSIRQRKKRQRCSGTKNNKSLVGLTEATKAIRETLSQQLLKAVQNMVENHLNGKLKLAVLGFLALSTNQGGEKYCPMTISELLQSFHSLTSQTVSTEALKECLDELQLHKLVVSCQEKKVFASTIGREDYISILPLSKKESSWQPAYAKALFITNSPTVVFRAILGFHDNRLKHSPKEIFTLCSEGSLSFCRLPSTNCPY